MNMGDRFFYLHTCERLCQQILRSIGSSDSTNYRKSISDWLEEQGAVEFASEFSVVNLKHLEIVEQLTSSLP